MLNVCRMSKSLFMSHKKSSITFQKEQMFITVKLSTMFWQAVRQSVYFQSSRLNFYIDRKLTVLLNS